jgi:D-beta-D-heptose 7-phosphate kinase/D-beta-D-heptose 1-phosphate adenosyltransferase
MMEPVRPGLDVLATFPRQRVLVIGDAMLDRYAHGTADRICREAPVPIVALGERHDYPGGAANAAANVAALGGQVRFVTALGDDDEGALLRTLLDRAGVDLRHALTVPGRHTLAKQRIMANGQLLLRLDAGSTTSLSGEPENQLMEALQVSLEWCTVLLVSDYEYGILTPSILGRIAEHARSAGIPIIVDAKSLSRYRDVGVTAIKPNRAEALGAMGISSSSNDVIEAVESASHRLLDLAGAAMAAITLDRDGSVLVRRDQPPYRVHARGTASPRTAGAGDTYLAALALALSAGADGPSAVELAGAAADLAVAKEETAVCLAEELRAYLARDRKVLQSTAELQARLGVLRAEGRRIVLTCGCFDLLHPGHVAFLERARQLGDVLVVALNDDASVARVKGPGRPIQPLADRADVLAALGSVDLLVPLHQDSASALVEELRPDVFAKGTPYTRATVLERATVEACGGRVEILPHVEHVSTAQVLSRLRSSLA